MRTLAPYSMVYVRQHAALMRHSSRFAPPASSTIDCSLVLVMRGLRI